MGEERSVLPGGADTPAGRGEPGLREVGDAMSDAFRLLQASQDPQASQASQASQARQAPHASQSLRASPAPDSPTPAHRLRTDHETVGEDLLKLVLTLVELLRQLIERQALRRVEEGGLSDEQEEELGATLMALHDRLADLCAEHGYALEDLNLDLGPLGPLLPPRSR
ncbi:gas vesicle protein K [Streptomyces sp. NPDC048111]|uniref:gas vesicle protein K n=1 Tax=Streptomyces sp. NPDC048111 TaxID=3365500 RepID=UPI0037129DB7